MFFPDEIRRDLMSRFYHSNRLKSSGSGGGRSSGADIAINPALNFLPPTFQTLKTLLERQSDETALQL